MSLPRCQGISYYSLRAYYRVINSVRAQYRDGAKKVRTIYFYRILTTISYAQFFCFYEFCVYTRLPEKLLGFYSIGNTIDSQNSGVQISKLLPGAIFLYTTVLFYEKMEKKLVIFKIIIDKHGFL